MRLLFRKFKGLGFILWHSRHEFYHVLLGLVWAWFLRELWQEFNLRWIIICVLASLVPDIEHFFYFFSYGKKEAYTIEVKAMLRNRAWRALVSKIESGHKYNTNLAFHNYYFMGGLLIVSLVSYFIEWQIGVILFGAMVIHYLFDIFDDWVTLGYINENWRRWRRGKRGLEA